MLLVLYASAVLLAVTQNVTARTFFNRNSRSDSAVFNGIKSLSALVLFVGYTLVTGSFGFDRYTLFYGVLYGVCLSLSMCAGYYALSLGKLALTGTLVWRYGRYFDETVNELYT